MHRFRIRRVVDPADPAIAAFGRLQESYYPEPDLLIPPVALPRMISNQGTQRYNFLLVAEMNGVVVGGTVFHLLVRPNSGFSSFLVVSPASRGRGIARALHEARLSELDAQAGTPVAGLFIDTVAPERLTLDQWQKEWAAGFDPVLRRSVFHQLGFRKVDVAYYQPPPRPGQEPITSLDLLYCPRTSGQEFVAADLIVETMHAYWLPWLGKATADEHAVALRKLCRGPMVRLLPAYTVS